MLKFPYTKFPLPKHPKLGIAGSEKRSGVLLFLWRFRKQDHAARNRGIMSESFRPLLTLQAVLMCSIGGESPNWKGRCQKEVQQHATKSTREPMLWVFERSSLAATTCLDQVSGMAIGNSSRAYDAGVGEISSGMLREQDAPAIAPL
jgi:hypothetical protein